MHEVLEILIFTYIYVYYPGPDLIKLGPSAQFFSEPPSQNNVLEEIYIERRREC